MSRLLLFFLWMNHPLPVSSSPQVLHYRHPDSGETPAPPSAPDVAPEILTRYFFTLQLTARYQIIGIGEISEEAAATANCYAITTNQGHIQRIDYLRAGQPELDPFFHVQRIDFDYLPGIERRWYRNAQDHPVANNNGVVGEELILNATLGVTDVINLDERGARTEDIHGVTHYLRNLDAADRVISAERMGFLGLPTTDNQGYTITRSVYDAQDHRIEYDNFDANNLPLNDKEGVAITRDFYTLDPDLTQLDESYFDASGLPAQEASTGIHQRTKIYDRRGLLLSESYFDKTGAPALDRFYGIHEQRHVFDDYGNVLSDQFFGSDNQPCNNKSTGIARIDYTYDSRNRIVEKDFSGKDGKLARDPSGMAVLRQEYDDSGNLSRCLFYDELRDPTPHRGYGSPAIRLDRHDAITIVSLRDDHDQPMKQPSGGFASFSYVTDHDKPLSPANNYYDLQGRKLSEFRVRYLNPFLALLKSNLLPYLSIQVSLLSLWLGALLGLVWNSFLLLKPKGFASWLQTTVRLLISLFFGEGLIWCLISAEWVGTGGGFLPLSVFLYTASAAYLLLVAYRFYRLKRPLPMKKNSLPRTKALSFSLRLKSLSAGIFLYSFLFVSLSYLLWELWKR